MRLLRGRIERVAVGARIVVAKIRARLHRIGREPGIAQIKLDDLGGRRHRGFGFLPVAALDLEHHVGAELLVDERRADFHGFAQIAYRRQNFVIDDDRLGGGFGREAIFSDNRRDNVADVTHLVGREGRARRAVHRPAVAERHRMHDRQFAVTGALPVRGRQHQKHSRKIP